MRRRTTTAQINEAFPMMEVVKAEYYNKDTYTTAVIDNDVFTENFQFLAESGKLTSCQDGHMKETLNQRTNTYLKPEE